MRAGPHSFYRARAGALTELNEGGPSGGLCRPRRGSHAGNMTGSFEKKTVCMHNCFEPTISLSSILTRARTAHRERDSLNQEHPFFFLNATSGDSNHCPAIF